MGRFFKILKYKEVYLCEYKTLVGVMERLRIPDFIEEVYNLKRLYTALGYFSSNDFEEVGA